ncbi:MAG: PAS domain S-box protein, partial [Rhodocyclaceae bacterium]
MPQQSPQAARRSALSIVLLYAIFAGLWILLSDKLVQWLTTDPARAALANTLKGWLFVLVTSLLLFRLMQHWKGYASSTDGVDHGRRPSLVLTLILTLIVLLTAFAAGQNFVAQRDLEVARLQTIADIEAREIGKGIRERIDLAVFVQTHHQLANQYTYWRTNHDRVSGDLLRTQLDQLRQTQNLTAIQLLDEQGRHLWGSANVPADLPPALKGAIEKSIADHQVHWVGPYRDDSDMLSLDFIAPIITANGHPPLVVLHTNPDDWLYHTLQSWPVPSNSGETLLVRREGDQVLFLNELRHRQDTAAKLSIPLSASALLANQVLDGEAEAGQRLEGEDYRGVAVLGVAQPVPGTDWLLIAKIDRNELYAAIAQSTLWIVLAGLMALFVAAAGTYLLRQRHQLALAAGVQQAQADRLRSLQLLSAIADGSNDAIFAQDTAGRYILFNRAACTAVGKPEDEVLGQDDHAIYPIAQADVLVAIGRQAMAENRNITTDEIHLSTARGERTFFSTRGPLHDAEGHVVGNFGIHQDITERKANEQAVRESEARFRALVEQSLAGIYIIQDGRFHYVNPVFATIFGYDAPEELIGLSAVERVISPECRELVVEKIRQRLAGEKEVDHYTFTGLRKDGSRIELEVHGRAFDYQGRRAVIGVILDITARKAAEDALRASEIRFQDIVQASADWVWEVDAEGHYTFVSDSVKDILDYTPAEVLGKKPMDFMPKDEAIRVTAGYASFVERQVPFRDMEHSSLRKDGSLCYVRVNGVPVKDKDGHLVGYRGVGRDITERKRAEQELKNSEVRFRTLFDNASVAIMIHEQGTLKVLDANPRAITARGYATLEELQQGKFWSTSPYGYEDALLLGHKAASEGPQHFEWRRDGPNGEVFWDDVMLSEISLGDEQRMLSIAVDITARKSAEEALHTNARYLRALLDNFPFMVWLKDTESRFLAANKALAQAAGLADPEELKGK